MESYYIIEKADIICVSKNESSKYLNKSSVQWLIILMKYIISVRPSLKSLLNKKSLKQKGYFANKITFQLNL